MFVSTNIFNYFESFPYAIYYGTTALELLYRSGFPMAKENLVPGQEQQHNRQENKRRGKKQHNLQSQLDTDLWVIVIISLAALGICMAFQSPLYGMVRDTHIHVLLRTLLAAACQFGLAGLGISVVSIYRKESFRSHGPGEGFDQWTDWIRGEVAAWKR